MKGSIIIFVLITACFARLTPISVKIDGDDVYENAPSEAGREIFIAPIRDYYSILSPQGKSITVCQHGDNVAVIYGAPTADPNNPVETFIAYSLDSGATWTTYGAFAPELRRIYPAVDGSPNFCTNYGELWFVWQESPFGYNTGDLKVMIEEGTPSAPSTSVPRSLPNASDLSPWLPCVAVDPDDPYSVIVTAWSYLHNGNCNVYAWISSDGAYTWTDTIFMCYIDPSGINGHMRRGTGNYVFYTYHDLYNISGSDVVYPYYIESTDGGYTWSEEYPLPVPYVNPDSSMFWWCEFDCEVVNNEPWAVHTDLGLDSLWLFHGTGSPGTWTWEVFNVTQFGVCSLTINDTMFYCYPIQRPNVSYETMSNTILISYKAYYLKVHGNDTTYDGEYWGGVYSTDNGATWTITGPLSDSTIDGFIEVAHRLVNINGDIYAYGLWAGAGVLGFNFVRGAVKPFYTTGIAENSNNSLKDIQFTLSPTVVTNLAHVSFHVPKSGNATLTLFDVTGRFVESVFNGVLDKGTNTININTSKLAKGIYFVSLKTEVGTQTAKFIIAR